MLSRMPLRMAIPRVPQPRIVRVIGFWDLRSLVPLGTVRVVMVGEWVGVFFENGLLEGLMSKSGLTECTLVVISTFQVLSTRESLNIHSKLSLVSTELRAQKIISRSR